MYLTSNQPVGICCKSASLSSDTIPQPQYTRDQKLLEPLRRVAAAAHDNRHTIAGPKQPMPALPIPSIVQQHLLDANSATISRSVSGGLSGASIYQGVCPLGNVCLRCWPTKHPSPERLATIHSHLRQAKDHGIGFVPEVYCSKSGKTSVSDGSRLWELTQWLPGEPVSTPDMDQCRTAMHSLAKLHACWQQSHVRFQVSPGIAERTSRLAGWLKQLHTLVDRFGPAQGTIDSVSEAVQRSGHWELPQLAQRTINLLHSIGPSLHAQLSSAAQLQVSNHWVIRDIWSDHVLFENSRVSGIIDYGASRHDEPALDVARLTGSYFAADFDAWHSAASHYWQAREDARCQPLCQEALDFDDWFARLLVIDRANCLLSALQWLEWLVLSPRQFPVPTLQLVGRWTDFLDRCAAHEDSNLRSNSSLYPF
ncbi:MAG TPA: hypothetical protein DDW52_22380 [Planctomycetaceae bacterium]|nr:hypothetical protein [Planctomycetaceae bacterium]